MTSPPASPAAREQIKPLEWSEVRAPIRDVLPYDHTVATTPWGKYRIEWKSWKGYDDGYVVYGPGHYEGRSSETWIGCEDSLDEAKEVAWEDYAAKITAALEPPP